jgi:hypothetical protein
MSYLGARNAISLGTSYQATLGGPNLLYKLAPSLLLQFAGAESLDSRVTFTRTTTATRTNSSGVIESVAINGPRFDYNPTTLAPLGLLIEEQRTNLVLNSLIDGTSLSTQIVATAAVSTTLSFYGTGQIVLSGSSSATVVGTGAYPSRRTLTFTPTVGALTLTVTGVVQYAQLENGSFPTSYIPTAASQVTRTADVATMTGTNFSSWYNATEGTIYAEGILNNTAVIGAQIRRLVDINDNTTNNRITMGRSAAATSARFQYAVSGTILNTTNGQTIAGVFPSARLAVAFKAGDYACSGNGSAATTSTAASVPVVDRLSIGGDATATANSAANGTISRIAFYPRRLANAELQAITS